MSKLRPISNTEIAMIATDLQTIVGSQLQECLQTVSGFGLGFYHGREIIWLWIDLNPSAPAIIRFQRVPPIRNKITRPLLLFVRSKFRGRRLSAVRADVVRGRILIFQFHLGSDEEVDSHCEIEVRLFPRGQNIIARYGDRSVAELKPKEIVAAPSASESESARSWSDIELQWQVAKNQGSDQKSDQLNSRNNDQSRGLADAKPSSPAVQSASLEKEWRRAIEKKGQAIKKMREELVNKTSPVFENVGEWLKANATLELPPEWLPEMKAAVDQKRSLSWNIEECFRRAKENKRKAVGTRARLEAVEGELADLQSRGPSALERSAGPREKDASLLSRAEAKGRRHPIAPDLEIYVGRSAADNIALLRRAQPFDYWLHLREQPGSHAILRRARGRQVHDHEFVDAGRWVIEQTMKKRIRELKGQAFDLLIVECRYVRPIKGDKLGRVHYSHDRVMRIRC